MSNPALKYKSIFCLEGEWNSRDLRDKTSVKYLLTYMEETLGVGHVFRKVNSRQSFIKYVELLNKGKSKFKSFGILYLAFHGSKGCISLDDGEEMELNDILEFGKEALRGRIIHFGSCSTLKLSKADLKDFFKKSGAKAVSGFSKDIPFLESSVFDLAYLSKLNNYDKPGYIDKYIEKNLSELSAKLGFVYIDKNE